jgi:CRP-like cAMP-binding protein
MVSPELLRRFPFFSGFSMDQIVVLAKDAEEIEVPRDHYFHHEGEELSHIYIILEGELSLVTNLPQKDQEVTLGTLGTGDLFGWSSFVPPYASTAGAKATTPVRAIDFDTKVLRECFEEDPRFGYLFMQKIAQVVRDRLNALRIETIAYTAG